MTRPRSADDFDAIRARMQELRRECTQPSVEKDSRAVIEPPLYPDSGAQAPLARRGIPGWRVARRKRLSSE